MLYVKSGENTMNGYKFIFSVLIIAAIYVFGCSGDSTDTTKETSAGDQGVAKKELLTAEDSILQMINEPWERVLYNDNSGFYENEFSYLTDETSFDKYLTFGQITYRMEDDVMDVEITHLELYRPDSALVGVKVRLLTPKGEEKFFQDTMPVYYFEDRWIKPTVSVLSQQRGYEDRIRQAIEAAEKESN